MGRGRWGKDQLFSEMPCLHKQVCLADCWCQLQSNTGKVISTGKKVIIRKCQWTGYNCCQLNNIIETVLENYLQVVWDALTCIGDQKGDFYVSWQKKVCPILHRDHEPRLGTGSRKHEEKESIYLKGIGDKFHMPPAVVFEWVLFNGSSGYGHVCTWRMCMHVHTLGGLLFLMFHILCSLLNFCRLNGRRL